MGRFSRLETKQAEPDKPAGAQTPPPAPAPAQAAPRYPAAAPGVKPDPFTYDAPGHLARGLELFFSGHDNDGLRWMSRAIQENPGLLDAWVNHTRAQLLMNHVAEAFTWVQRAMAIFPDAPALVALRAAVNARKGMTRAAIGGCDMALERDNASPDVWLSRGQALLVAESRNADFCFEQCLALTPDMDWKTPFWVGLILDQERQWSRSIGYYERALVRRSTLPYAWFRIGLAHAALGRPDAARKALLEAERLCGDDEKLRQRIIRAKPGSMLTRLTGLFRK